MARRYRVGRRRYTAVIEKHNGKQDEYGSPDYKTDANWEVVARWPCEMFGVKGQEQFRGRQVTATTSHVLYGDYMAVRKVTSDMRIRIRKEEEMILAILDVTDFEGDRTEMIIDARVEG